MQIQCPHCGRKFDPPPGLVLAANERLEVRCTECGERWFITASFTHIVED